MITQQQLLDFKIYLEKRYPVFIVFELDNNVRNEQYILIVLFEIIKEQNKNKGFGTKVMNEIINFSNKYKIPITLTPTDYFCSDINRLINFYKRFDFIENNDTIFSEKMFYIPK